MLIDQRCGSGRLDTFERLLGADETGGYGLLSMAERAEIVGGRLNIRSRARPGHHRHRHHPAAIDDLMTTA